jgi:hypothetical protein
MDKKIMEVPVDDLLESLKEGYKEYKKGLENNSDVEDLGHIKGFCTTIEQILSSYGSVSSTEMMEIKKPIIGNVSLERKNKVDYDRPTYLRMQKD